MASGSSGKRGSFGSTHWSLIGQVQHGDTATRLQALDRLLTTYYPPLRAHLIRGKRIKPDLADDLLQGFITDKILEKDLVNQADRTRGRFRSLLLRSLENYLVDQLRRKNVRKRAEERKTRSEASQSHCQGCAKNATTDAFSVDWARQVVSQALRQMRSECQRQGRTQVWSVFVARLVRPLFTRAVATPYEVIVEQFGFASPEQASNTLLAAKRQFRRVVRSVLGQYCQGQEEVEAEIVSLRGDLLAVQATDLGSIAAELVDVTDCTSGDVPEAHETNIDVLAEMIDLETERDSLWPAEEMAALLRHQMSIPLQDALSGLSPGTRPPSGDATNLVLSTFNDLLEQKKPSLEVLRTVKRLTKKSINSDASACPREVATALYFASIALALVRHGTHISGSDHELLRIGMQLARSRAWNDPRLRELFQEALGLLADGDRVASGD